MKIFRDSKELSAYLDLQRDHTRSIGFVPTMGALHQGHFSLMNRSHQDNDITVVSIFVNPTQFNDPEDLKRYPRNLEADLNLLSEHPVDVVFAPSEKEIYPEKDMRQFNLSPLDTIMEGKHRPGHFNGVAQVVSRLFQIVQPDRAYFGLKDFQQFVIIKKLVSMLDMPIEIVGCPIIREEDGLAMSSRNQLLSESERKTAPLIRETLKRAREMMPHSDPAEIKKFVRSSLNAHPSIEVDYFEIVDDQHLKPVKSWDSSPNKVGCVAVQLGRVRLIDNIFFN